MPCAESVHIVGAQGRMGHMLRERMRKAGLQVQGSDLSDMTNLGEDPDLRNCGVVLVCVPPAALQQCLSNLAPRLNPDQLLMDVTSVKTLPMQWMEAAHQGPVVGSHPLFGPQPGPGDLRVALVAGARANDSARQLAEKLYTALGCSVFWTTATEHDRQTGLAQSLNFGINAAFFSLLADSGLRPEFVTPSCRRLLDAARKLLTEDRAMFLEFSALNPEFPDILHKFRQNLHLEDPAEFARVAARATACYTDLN